MQRMATHPSRAFASAARFLIVASSATLASAPLQACATAIDAGLRCLAQSAARAGTISLPDSDCYSSPRGREAARAAGRQPNAATRGNKIARTQVAVRISKRCGEAGATRRARAALFSRH